MKKIIRTLIFVLAIASTSNYIEVNAQEIKASTDIVNIPDNNLKVCINQKLMQGDNDDITESQMRSFSDLNCSGKDIKKIEGLQYSTSLRKLYLNDNEVSDLTPISSLTSLESLSLDSNGMKDITQISKFTHLKELSLADNEISDITPISSLTKITDLRLPYNKISDITPISTLINVETLHLYNNEISDITPISSLTKITDLNLAYNQISDITPLKNIDNFFNKKYYLSHNQISDISPLKDLYRIELLDLTSNQISDITPLEKMTYLAELYLNDNQISDISILEKGSYGRLKSLLLSDNQITDISALSNLTSLDRLYLVNNGLTDLTPLSKLTNLGTLNLTNNQISDITPLSNLIKLGVLHLSENQISDITPLSKLTNVIKLGINHNQISDITPLSGMSRISDLDLNNNQINDVTPIQSLSRLSNLNLSENQIVNFSPLGYKVIKELDTTSQNISIDLGEFTYLKDIPKEYKIKVTEQHGTEHEVTTPIDNVKIGINSYTQAYDFEDKSVVGNRYSGNVNLTFKYKNEKPVFSGVDDVTINENDAFDPLQGVSATDAEDGDLTSKVVVDDSKLQLDKPGEYVVTYSVADSESQTVIVDRKVTVKAVNKKPVFSGVDDVTVNMNSTFDPMQGVSATDVEDGDLTSKITVDDSKLQLDKPGEYVITYSVTDSGLETVTADRKVKVINEKPVFTGVDDVTVNMNSTFDPMQGVGATDKEDGDLTSKITVDDSKLELGKPGEYVITYSVTDSGLETVTADRKVIVINEKPVFAGLDDITVNMNSTLDLMQGVSATDKEDGELTSKIVVDDSKLELDKPGEYVVTYSVTDSGLETVTADRKVTVINEKPTFTGVDDVTVNMNSAFDPMQGVSATDVEDGELTSKITVDDSKLELDKPGEYVITYSVTDSGLETVTADRKVTVINEKPTFTGVDDVTVNMNSTFDPMQGVGATDKEDGDLTSKIVVDDSKLQLDKPGEYVVTYSVTDSGLETVTADRKVTVTNEKPTFTGVDDVVLSEEDSFDPLKGVSATDKEDGDLTSKIKVFTKISHEISHEDKLTEGEYIYYYSVTDSAGVESKVQRKVSVSGTNEKPVIDGINDVTLNINDSFDPMAGVSASDKEDGDLTSKVSITKNNLVVSKAGSYKITYSVSDRDGNKTEGSRNIKVVDNTTSKPGDGGDITPMKPGTDDKDNTLSKTGSNMLVISIVAIAALLLIKKSYKL